MKKQYLLNGTIYNFVNVYKECGMLYGMCITFPHCGKWAWLDSNGFQFEGRRRVAAEELADSPRIDNSYTMWGGELRDKLPHGARYYQRGRW